MAYRTIPEVQYPLYFDFESVMYRLSIWARKCRHCGASTVRRSSKRNLFEQVLALILLPFRCETCDQRWFKIRFL